MHDCGDVVPCDTVDSSAHAFPDIHVRNQIGRQRPAIINIVIPESVMDYTSLHGRLWLFRLRLLSILFALRVRVLSDIARPAVPPGLEAQCTRPNWEVPLSLYQVCVRHMHLDIHMPLTVS